VIEGEDPPAPPPPPVPVRAVHHLTAARLVRRESPIPSSPPIDSTHPSPTRPSAPQAPGWARPASSSTTTPAT
jgi:hypothetical protein